MGDFMFLESTARGIDSWRKGQETYWEKLYRISRHSRHLVRIDRRSAHETTYVLAMLPDDGPIYLPVVCETLSMMERE